MTIDALRARKRELLARKKVEQERLERGEGDKFTLAEIKEELITVNAQIRTLTHGQRRTNPNRNTQSALASDYRQFLDWQQRDQAADNDSTWDRMRSAAAESLEGLTKAQSETLTLRSSGMKQKEIAAKLSVHKATVSRTLARAKKNATKYIQLSTVGNRITDGTNNVDLTNRTALRAVALAMTPNRCCISSCIIQKVCL